MVALFTPRLPGGLFGGGWSFMRAESRELPRAVAPGGRPDMDEMDVMD